MNRINKIEKTEHCLEQIIQDNTLLGPEEVREIERRVDNLSKEYRDSLSLQTIIDFFSRIKSVIDQAEEDYDEDFGETQFLGAKTLPKNQQYPDTIKEELQSGLESPEQQIEELSQQVEILQLENERLKEQYKEASNDNIKGPKFGIFGGQLLEFLVLEFRYLSKDSQVQDKDSIHLQRILNSIDTQSITHFKQEFQELMKKITISNSNDPQTMTAFRGTEDENKSYAEIGLDTDLVRNNIENEEDLGTRVRDFRELDNQFPSNNLTGKNRNYNDSPQFIRDDSQSEAGAALNEQYECSSDNNPNFDFFGTFQDCYNEVQNIKKSKNPFIPPNIYWLECKLTF